MRGFADYEVFDQELKAENARLKGASLPTIRRKGNMLYARATCPPKPGAKDSRSCQQDVRLGLPAELASLKAARQKVKRIAGELASGSFDWCNYLPATKVAKLKAEAEKVSNPRASWVLADWVTEFTKLYFERRPRTETTEETFQNHFLTYFSRLPQNVSLTLEILKEVVLMTAPDSYSRWRACIVFKQLAELMGFNPQSIHELRGNYCPTKPAPRDLPSDELIEEWFDKIPNPDWKWVYGVMATYGLRPHECFHLDTTELEQGGYAINVLANTKTGAHRVMPLRTEWIERFHLRARRLPKVTGKTNRILGQRINQALRQRYKMPFLPYSLRHAYAVRWIGVPNIKESLVARWMGHSVGTHTQIYQAWLSEKEERRVFEQYVLGQQD